MPKKFKYSVICVSILLILIGIFLIFSPSFFPSLLTIRFYPDEPNFVSGTKWKSIDSESEMLLTVNEDGSISGTVSFVDINIPIEANIRAGSIFFFIDVSSDESVLWFTGDYKISKNGDMTIKRIKWIEKKYVIQGTQEDGSLMLEKH